MFLEYKCVGIKISGIFRFFDWTAEYCSQGQLCIQEVRCKISGLFTVLIELTLIYPHKKLLHTIIYIYIYIYILLPQPPNTYFLLRKYVCQHRLMCGEDHSISVSFGQLPRNFDEKCKLFNFECFCYFMLLSVTFRFFLLFSITFC